MREFLMVSTFLSLYKAETPVPKSLITSTNISSFSQKKNSQIFIFRFVFGLCFSGQIVMKRERESAEIQGFDIAKCLMLLSQGLAEAKPKSLLHSDSEVFECKTCHRRFSSFQALGGHRASHKKPRLMGEKPNEQTRFLTLSTKPKTHECSICGQEFSMGQALGGHMRRHRAAMNDSFSPFPIVPTVPLLKRSNSSKRVVCMDLNLTPLENDLQILFGTKAPKVDLCI